MEAGKKRTFIIKYATTIQLSVNDFRFKRLTYPAATAWNHVHMTEDSESFFLIPIICVSGIVIKIFCFKTNGFCRFEKAVKCFGSACTERHSCIRCGFHAVYGHQFHNILDQTFTVCLYLFFKIHKSLPPYARSLYI